MKIALAYGDKFSVDAEYSYDEGYELIEQNGKIVQHDYHVIEIEKVIVSFIGLTEIDITKQLTREHINALTSQIQNEIEF